MSPKTFEISNLHNDPGSPRLWWAEVKMNFEDNIGDYDVAHWVTVKVRVIADDSVTVLELRERLFQKAVEQLFRSMKAVEGKTAQELLEAAEAQQGDMTPMSFDSL